MSDFTKAKQALRECIHAIHTRGPGPRVGQLEEALAELEAAAPTELEALRHPSGLPIEIKVVAGARAGSEAAAPTAIDVTEELPDGSDVA